MTKEEAKTVIEIMSGCDGGCINCVGYLVQDFMEEFPEFKLEEIAEWFGNKNHAYTKEDLLEHLAE